MGGIAWVAIRQDIRLDFHFSGFQAVVPNIHIEESTQVTPFSDGPVVRNVSQLISHRPSSSPTTTISPDDSKRARQEAYVKQYVSIAQREMQSFGIPASIKLAQALLESQEGQSKLAQKNNNHFGIKCFSRSCQRGHCSNFTDDSHKDFFRIYPDAAASYRAHSQFLHKERYRHLHKFSQYDYRSWAHGLKRAGYATDPAYAEKLIRLIERLQLYRFDEL